MGKVFSGALTGRLTWSIADQMFLSAFSFGLNLLLIRLWGPELFGVFAIILAVTMIAYSVQQALIGAQLAVLRQHAPDAMHEKELLATLWMANSLVTLTAIVVASIGIGLIWDDQLVPHLSLSAGLFVGCTLVREYVRSLLFSEFRVSEVFATDVVFVAVAVTGLAGFWWLSGGLDLGAILLTIAGANILASVISILRNPGSFVLTLNRSLFARYASVWRNQSRWALLGVATSELINRGHVFVVGAWFGVAAVGVIQAGEMIFRPLGMVLQGWKRIAQPTFAHLVNKRDFTSLQTYAHLSAIGAGAIALLFIALLWAAWGPLEAQVFRGQYKNIELVVKLWGLTFLMRLITGVYSTALEGFARFRELSLTSLAGACVTVVALSIAVALESYPLSILAIAAGLMVDTVLVLVILSGILNSSAASIGRGGQRSPSLASGKRQSMSQVQT